jgi:hypothetical protein
VFLAEGGQPSLRVTRRTLIWPAVILLAALLLRVTFLESVPGGLHVDESGIADFSLRHIFPRPGETLNPFRTGPSSQPSLYHYLVRLSLAVGGQSISGLRLSSALTGAMGCWRPTGWWPCCITGGRLSSRP